jgi:hypothetical protein
VAGVGGLELRNVDANYLFERSHRFAGIQPNSGCGDYSRLSCGATSGSQWLHEIKLEVEGPDGGGIRREEPGALGPSQWLPRPYLGDPRRQCGRCHFSRRLNQMCFLGKQAHTFA